MHFRLRMAAVLCALLATTSILPLFDTVPAAAAGQILCVSTSGAATSSPCANATAYTTIQAAVGDATDGTEIRIAGGTYTSNSEYVVTIQRKQVSLLGGYADNNWQSADPGNTTILDGRNVFTVVQVFGTSATFERLTITRGAAVGSSGGGVDANLGMNDTLTINDSVISENSAKWSGGGLFVVGGAAILNRTQVLSNTTVEADGAGFYGARLIANDSVFRGNRAQRHAGGIDSVYAVLNRTTIANNIAVTGVGGGLVQSDEGGTFTILSSRIISNTSALQGGGMYMQVGFADISLKAEGTVFADNRSSVAVDGLFASDLVTLTNVTLASAELAPHAALGLNSSTTITLTNTIVASHTIGMQYNTPSTIKGDYNLFFGNDTDLEVNGSSTPLAFTHVLAADPRFSDPFTHDYHLENDSPAIDAGDPSRSYAGQRDIDSQPIPDGRADIGADERQVYTNRVFLPLVTK